MFRHDQGKFRTGMKKLINSFSIGNNNTHTYTIICCILQQCITQLSKHMIDLLHHVARKDCQRA